MAALSSFNWEDPLDLESQLTDEEKMIRDAARAFAADKLQPRVKSAFREERFDREIMTELGEMG
ncbi:MAG: acyl-CoA dehydrogenase family protein, partial [Aestuariivirga sp.]